jgi:hypothetical protein
LKGGCPDSPVPLRKEDVDVNLKTILLAAAVICFVIDAVGVGTKVRLLSLGLACGFGSFLV